MADQMTRQDALDYAIGWLGAMLERREYEDSSELRELRDYLAARASQPAEDGAEARRLADLEAVCAKCSRCQSSLRLLNSERETMAHLNRVAARRSAPGSEGTRDG